jgi:hypothetical protein
MHVIDAHYEIDPFDSWAMTQHIQSHEATGSPPHEKRLISMSKTFLSLATAALAFTALATVPARAAEIGGAQNVKTVGALTLETQGVATSDLSVHRQGGFALPGSVQWIDTPADQVRTRQAAF